jgi:hypothetical protein
MSEFAQNINEFSVGQTIIDDDGAQCFITNKTANTIEVYIQRKQSKCRACNGTTKLKVIDKEGNKTTKECEECVEGITSYGVDVTEWFDMRTFTKRFKVAKTV